MSDERQQALEIARSLEKRGQTDAAVKSFLRLGAIEEAARALAGVKRYNDAGHLVMDYLGVGPALVGGLDDAKKKLAMKAAVCFAQGGEPKRAIELFMALGDVVRAAEVAERAGDKVEAGRIRARMERKGGPASVDGAVSSTGAVAGRQAAQRLEAAGQLDAALQQWLQLKSLPDAARVAYRLKKFVDAAQLFEDAGMPFEAAACFAEGGETGRCLEAVVRVPREHPKYRTAAAQAIRLGADLNVLDFKLDQFLGPYVAEGPKDERDLEAFYVLAKLYRARDHLENAREVYKKILAASPKYRDVAQRLQALDAESKGQHMAYEQIVREDAAFKGGAKAPPRVTAPAPPLAEEEDPFPDLPELGPAPAPVVAPPRTAYGIAAPSGAAKRAAPSDPSGPVRYASGQLAAVRHGTTTAKSGSGAHELNMPGELSDGSIIADRYRVEAKIGQGGMAAVYKATDLELNEVIAIKLFLQPSDDPQLLARFKQELTLSRNLAHPNIVRLYDIGQHRGCRFITMEMLHGTDLNSIIEGKPIELARGLRYLIQACSALALAHDKGVIHRDIKPANFFVTDDDQIKMMDFGIAKKSDAALGMTVAGFIAGTPAYMSPEQINNFAAVSYRTDIYALGCVAYEMFTGTVPFDHEQMMNLLMMHLTVAPEPPRRRNPRIPQELEDLILKLLEKKPEDRIQSCKEIGERLAAMLAKLPR
jgi:serine/threonine-protein kinase